MVENSCFENRCPIYVGDGWEPPVELVTFTHLIPTPQIFTKPDCPCRSG